MRNFNLSRSSKSYGGFYGTVATTSAVDSTEFTTEEDTNGKILTDIRSGLINAAKNESQELADELNAGIAYYDSWYCYGFCNVSKADSMIAIKGMQEIIEPYKDVAPNTVDFFNVIAQKYNTNALIDLPIVEQQQDEEDEGEDEPQPNNNLLIGGSVLGTAVLLFLVYQFLIKPKQGGVQ